MDSTLNATTDLTINEVDIPVDISNAVIIVTVVVAAIVACIGLMGNTLVIASVISYTKLRSVHTIFIINLAFADLLVNIILAPSAIVGALTKGSPFY